ncbi:MAG: outer membrane beta-barrel protein [Cyclobacteriaceae bacterium]|nr:TonB-dependent receptor family protein [Cyclobacteriaceae bacterium]MCH8516895.1 outer membrane beta-barrel protein [Cyclobacteriaceae bacterium]
MRYFTLLFLLLIPSLGLNAQTQTSITIWVTDEDNQGLPGATVQIWSEDFETFSVTDIEGKVSFELAHNSYDIKVKFFGKETATKSLTLKSQIDSLTIRLKDESLELDGIEISGMREFVNPKAGKIVVDIPGSPLAANNTLLEVMRFTPTIQVSDMSGIEVLNQATAIYIDHRLINLSGEDLMDFLENIPAETIQQIEVIHAPGASALGNIPTEIRIKTIDGSNLEGFRANLRYGGKMNTFYQQAYGGGFEFAKRNVSIRSSLYVTENNRRNRGDLSLSENQDRDLSTQSDVFGTSINHSSEINYRFASKTNAFINYRYISRNTEGFYKSEEKTGQNLIDEAETINTSGNHFITGGMVHEFDSSRTIAFQGEYLISRSEADNQVVQYTPFMRRDEQLQRLSPTAFAALDYKRQTSSGSFDIGARYSSLRMNIANRFAFYENQDRSELGFALNENISAIYSNWEGSLGKLEYSTGLRIENTDLDVEYSESTNGRKAIKNNYFSFLPNALISFNTDDGHNYSLGFRRTITRPDYYLLNPFRRFVGNMSSLEGDMHTRPQYDNTLTGTATFSSGVLFNAGVTFFEDFISIYLVDNPENNTIVQRYQNFDKGRLYFSNMSFTQFWSKKMATILKADIFYVKAQLDGVETGNPTTLRSYQVLHQYILGSGWKNTLTLDYQSAFSDGFFEHRSNFNVGYNLQKTFEGTGLTLLVGVNDLTANQVEGIKALYNSINYNSLNYADHRRVYLTLSYRFGNQRLKSNKAKRLEDTGVWNRLEENS